MPYGISWPAVCVKYMGKDTALLKNADSQDKHVPGTGRRSVQLVAGRCSSSSASEMKAGDWLSHLSSMSPVTENK